jgi:hypothetical protein
MAKKRPKPRVPDPVIVGGVPRWGTKKQGALDARERGYKNRIFELEQAQAESIRALASLAAQRDDLRRKLDAAASPRRIAALRKVCMLPLRESTDLGIADELLSLCAWLAELEMGIATQVKIAMDVASGKSPPSVPGTNPSPVFPPVSGITKTVPDHDDADSIDDLFARAVDVHLERMDECYYWLGITPIGGQTIHIDISQEKNHPIRARIRK